MLWDLESTSSHSEVDVRVVASVRNIENGNSQLEHEKVCFISFWLLYEFKLEYKTVFPRIQLCPCKQMEYVDVSRLSFRVKASVNLAPIWN